MQKRIWYESIHMITGKNSGTKPRPTRGPVQDPRLKYHPLGFLELVNKPTQDELQSYYAKTYYQNERGSYRKTYTAEELDYLQLKIAQKSARIDELLATRPSDRPQDGLARSLLDVGCGEGFTMAAFKDRGWSVEGLDFSSAGIEAMNPDMAGHLETGDMFALLKERIASGQRYDVIWLQNVLEHVLDPVGLLQDLHNLLHPGGVLSLTVPNDGNAYQEDLLRNGDIPDRFWVATPDHMAYFGYDSLKTTAEATGWNCADIIGDFPIDLFLLHEGSNYVKNRENGPGAHRARLRMESLIGSYGPARANDYYRALAQVGLGRDLTAFLIPSV